MGNHASRHNGAACSACLRHMMGRRHAGLACFAPAAFADCERCICGQPLNCDQCIAEAAPDALLAHIQPSFKEST